MIVAELSFQLSSSFREGIAYAYYQPLGLVNSFLVSQNIAISAPNGFEGSHCGLLKLHNGRLMRVPKKNMIPIIISLFFLAAEVRRFS